MEPMYEVGNPGCVWWSLGVIFVIAILGWSSLLRKKARELFVTVDDRPAAAGMSSGWLSAGLLCLGIVSLSIALMDIRWGKTNRVVPQRGLEVVFALDVSRSMLAEDANPNRLERAKQQIKDMVNEMTGDRIGLIVFAGDAKQVVPLTNHYEDFKQVLDSVGPHSVGRGGSQLGVALESASKAFLGKTNDHQTIVLFTDGEDQESKPVELARQIHTENETRIFTVGLGDMDEGARIPDRNTRRERFVEYQGRPVWSKLNGRILNEIATETNAAYIPAGTRRVNMAEIYHRFVATVAKSEFDTATVNAWIPRFQWFAGLAVLALLWHIWLSSGPVRPKKKIEDPSKFRSRSNQATNVRSVSTKQQVRSTAAILICVLFYSPVNAQDSQGPGFSDQVNLANELLRQQKPLEAIEAYQQIENPTPEQQAQLDFNLGVAHYRNSDFDAASTLFLESAKTNDTRVAADSRYNLGNCYYAKAVPTANKQPKVAIELLQKAIASYRSCLRLDPSNADARRNIELARKLISQLDQAEDEQPPPESPQDQDQQQSEDQESQEGEEQSPASTDDGQSGKEQEGQQNEGQQNEGQQNEDQQNEGQSADGQRGEESTQSQDAEGSQSNDPNASAEDSGSASSGNTPDPDSDTSDAEQDQQTSSEDEPTGAEDVQGELSTASGDESADDNQKGQQGMVGSQPNSDEQRVGQMTREEALKMLQAVRDRDMLRRLRMQQRQRSRRIRVEKDW